MAEFVFTSPDGRKFKVTGPDREGAIAAFEKAMRPSTAADRIAAARAGTLEASPESLERASASDQRAEDRMTIAGTGGYGAGLTAKAVEGIPFVGKWVDEGFDRLDPGRGERLRNLQDAMDRENPKASLAAEIGGGILGSIPLAAAGAPAIIAAGPKAPAMRAAAGVVTGAVAGGVEGGISGYGDGTTPEERAANAKLYGAFGAGAGGVLGGALPLASDFFQSLARRWKGEDLSLISKEFGVSRDAAKVLKTAFANNDQNAANRILRAGDEAALAAPRGGKGYCATHRTRENGGV